MALPLKMEVRYPYWGLVIIGILLNLHAVIGATDTCKNDLGTTNSAIYDLTQAIAKMKNDLKVVEFQATSRAAQARQAAELHGYEVKKMSALKSDRNELEEKLAIVLANYNVMAAPTADFGAITNYTAMKRAEVEEMRSFLIDILWRGQLQVRSMEEAADMLGQSLSWMNELLTTVNRHQATCTSYKDKGAATLNRINTELKLLESEATTDVAKLSAVQAGNQNILQGLRSRLGGQCIPNALYYDIINGAVERPLDPITFVSERCDTYTAGAMSDCVSELSEQKLKVLELTVTLENKTLTNDAMDCDVSKAEIDFAKCKLESSNCKRLLEEEEKVIRIPYPQMSDKTTHAIQLYNNIREIRLDRTLPLEKKVREIGNKLTVELSTVTDDYLTDRSYELHYLAMEEYVNQATKWLCSHFHTNCDAGKLCGLKSFSDMIPSTEEFNKNLSDLKEKFRRATMANDIIPYGTILPSTVYHYILKIPVRFSKEWIATDAIWSKMIEDMFRITDKDIYTTKSYESVLTKDVAWLVTNEVNSWLSLTPQMRIFISKVNELFPNINWASDAVKSLVECVCIGSDCSAVDTSET